MTLLMSMFLLLYLQKPIIQYFTQFGMISLAIQTSIALVFTISVLVLYDTNEHSLGINYLCTCSCPFGKQVNHQTNHYRHPESDYNDTGDTYVRYEYYKQGKLNLILNDCV